MALQIPVPPPAQPGNGSRIPERLFFAGPQPRSSELWWAVRVFMEFIRGFRTLHFVGPCVTVFGSARYREAHPYYALAREAGAAMANLGFTVMTGGGPGIMEAANRGAYDVNAPSIGLNITLPHEQFPNPYVTPDLCFSFHYFAMRKLHFLLRARALVAFPGGFGTFDEVFETLTLVQSQTIAPVPVVFVGEEYWRRAVDMEFLDSEGVIDPQDRELFWYAETAEEIWQSILAWNERHGTPLLVPGCGP